MLIRLNQPEIGSVARGKPFVSVEEELSAREHVVRHQRGVCVGNGIRHDIISAVRDDRVVLTRLVHPDEFLDGLTEIEIDLDGRLTREDVLISRPLYALHEIFVGGLREPSSFVGIQIDVVDVYLCFDERRSVVVSVEHCQDRTGVGFDALVPRPERDVELNFMVLESY